jgi:hypothetical protein
MRNRAEQRHQRRDITWNIEAILVASAVSRAAYVPPEAAVARPRMYVAQDVIEGELDVLALPSPQE